MKKLSGSDVDRIAEVLEIERRDNRFNLAGWEEILTVAGWAGFDVQKATRTIASGYDVELDLATEEDFEARYVMMHMVLVSPKNPATEESKQSALESVRRSLDRYNAARSLYGLAPLKSPFDAQVQENGSL